MIRYPVRITTETGSVYDISDRGICHKMNKDGHCVDAFKPFVIKAVPDTVTTLGEVYELEDSEPVIGQRMFISGLNNWWLSTNVVSVEYDA